MHLYSHMNWKRFLPFVGMGLFILFYLVAASRYPGGSWADPSQVGFSWRHNYLCDLLDTQALNGELNVGRYWARVALGVLCAGLLLLWYQLPDLMDPSPVLRRVLRLSGAAAFGTTIFLNSGTHDLTVRIAGIFGMVALLSAVIGLWRSGHLWISLLGGWCLGIFLLNYAVYETGSFIRMLPLIQKITFASFLGWFAWMNLALLRLHSRAAERQTNENSIHIS